MADPKYSAECWLTIPFAADYAVSDQGRVKRIAADPAYRHGRLLKHKIRADGYPEVTLYVDGALSLSVFIRSCAARFMVTDHAARTRLGIGTATGPTAVQTTCDG